jgi:hypothetical protein
MKKSGVWLLGVVFAVLILVIGATCMTPDFGSARVADGVAPTPNPIPMTASAAVAGSAYLADGVALTPNPNPMLA